MKNTQKWLLIVFTALTLAVVGTAVLAAGLPQETGSAALPKTTPERRTDIPMRTTDLSLFRLEKGSRALQIMKEVAACKKIRASEIEYYNLLPEEIKQLTHKEACARYEQLCRMGYDDIYNADISANEKNELLEKRNNLNSHLYFYIRLTAVGKDYLANRFEAVEGVAIRTTNPNTPKITLSAKGACIPPISSLSLQSRQSRSLSKAATRNMRFISWTALKAICFP